MNLVQLIGFMSPFERQQLQEMVSKNGSHLLSETAVTDSAGISSASKGDTAKTPNGIQFVKTEAGWRPELEVSTDSVLMLVKPEAKEVVKKGLDKLNKNEDYEILKSSLISDVLAPGNRLTFRKVDDDKFIDPTFLTDAQMTAMMSGSADVAAAVTGSGSNYTIGNAKFEITGSTVIVTAPSLDDLKILFGDETIAKAQEQSQKQGSDDIKIPVSAAADSGIFKALSKNIFVDMGIGNIKFSLQPDGTSYKTEFKTSDKSLKDFRDQMDGLVKTGKATKIAESRSRKQSSEIKHGLAALKKGKKLGYKHDPESWEATKAIVLGILGGDWAAFRAQEDLQTNVINALGSEGYYDLADQARLIAQGEVAASDEMMADDAFINETRQRVQKILRTLAAKR